MSSSALSNESILKNTVFNEEHSTAKSARIALLALNVAAAVGPVLGYLARPSDTSLSDKLDTIVPLL